MQELSIVAVDVGSLANIGWWREHTASNGATQGTTLDSLAQVIVEDLQAGRPVALGFEAPLFVPRVAEHKALNKQRIGEAGYPWCSGAGSGALALGIQHAVYVFEKIAEHVQPRVTMDLDALLQGDADFLIWEAFVSGAAKNKAALNEHVDDARVAVQDFSLRVARGSAESDISEPAVLNIAAAGLLASGLTSDVSLLKQSCVVIKPETFCGPLDTKTVSVA